MGRWQGCLSDPALGARVCWAVLPQRSGLRGAPVGHVPPVCPAGAVGELLPWLKAPLTCGGDWLVGRRRGGGRYRSAVTLLGGPRAGTLGGARGPLAHPSARVLSSPSDAFPYLAYSWCHLCTTAPRVGTVVTVGKLRVRGALGCPQDPQGRGGLGTQIYSRAPCTMLPRARELKLSPPPTPPPTGGRVTPRPPDNNNNANNNSS